MAGLLDMEYYTPTAKYLDPQQRQEAQNVGLLNAAMSLFNASAPRRGGTPAPTPFQMIGGAMQAYGQGANDYQQDDYKSNKIAETMQNDRAWKDYTAQNSNWQEGLGLPAGMPIDRDVAQKALIESAVQDKRYQHMLENQMQMFDMRNNSDLGQAKLALALQQLGKGGGGGGGTSAPPSMDTSGIPPIDASVLGAPVNQGGETGTVTNKPEKKITGEKLSASTQNIQNDAVDFSNAALMASNDAIALADRLDNGEIELGPLANLSSKARNFMGDSTPNSRGYQELSSNIETLRNTTLLLAKGVQTEGDAQRALNQLMENMNDSKVTAMRLRQIAEMNKRNAELYRQKTNNVRADAGFPPYNFESFDPILEKPSVFASPQQQQVATPDTSNGIALSGGTTPPVSTTPSGVKYRVVQ